MPDRSDFIKKILAGDPGAGARMIRLIEADDPQAFGLLRALYPHSGKAFIIGITGAPGAGKSTIINGLITQFRKQNFKVGVIAVDPTSPFSGGAILGDRLRMQTHATDENVFIRSMASRGRAGGLSRATRDAALVLDAMGHHILLIETVGAGQAEFEISYLAHSIGIVVVPGSCDGIQAVKAGILETGDIFIVNKGDMGDADVSAHQLSMVIEMGKARKTGWNPRVIKTHALEGLGLAELAAAFLAHRDFLGTDPDPDKTRKERETLYFNCLVRELAMKKLGAFMETDPAYPEIINQLLAREIDPFTAAEQVFKKIQRKMTHGK
ncbi:MAG: methylmalonyl Co-A mutase-associated GTPase MeaB [Proteobacteria bacterium]|nr:methylmalonyl Co-A mutase-associated GTPase MeaB [Desulfobacula sp.]MBU3954453.1 methylmalonyl Co-A mutase-associated GTPase MeaB [Pseudomonadota bacterium]MBU4129612.1 methylmalonyl Co-A mutase-associated GTPase MeaB [Pseudomonadota bacterium]